VNVPIKLVNALPYENKEKMQKINQSQ